MEGDSQLLDVRVLPQPTDSVCGPTCLHAVYRYFGRKQPLEELIAEIPVLPDGGTLAVNLGSHALKNGFRASIISSDLRLFDPTWFREGVDLSQKLREQSGKKSGRRLEIATQAYIEFLQLGGVVKLESINLSLLRSFIDRGLPVLAGLSATYLYDCPRELADGTYDDVLGEPSGHFVVVQGYDVDGEHVTIADPLEDNPGFDDRYYSVHIERLLAAIHLGIITYDANVLVIEPLPNEQETSKEAESAPSKS